MKKRAFFIGLMLVALLPITAHAQDIANLNTGNAHGIDTILASLKAAIAGWSGPLTTIALDLLATTLVIALVLEAGWTIISGDLMATFAVMVRQGLIGGGWYYIVSNWSQGLNFSNAILSSFQVAGQRAAGGGPVSPGNIMEIGLGFASRIMHETSVMGTVVDPGRTISLAFCAIVLVIVFAGVSAIVLMTIGKALIIGTIGTLAVGLGGWSVTRSLALNAFWMMMGSGARVLAQLLLLNLSIQVLNTAFSSSGPLGAVDGFAIIALGVVIGVLIWGVPAAAEHLFHGSGHGGGSISHAVRSMGQIAMAGSSIGNSVGAGMMASLPSSGGGGGGGGRAALPPAASGMSSGSGAAPVSSAGMSMRQRP